MGFLDGLKNIAGVSSEVSNEDNSITEVSNKTSKYNTYSPTTSNIVIVGSSDVSASTEATTKYTTSDDSGALSASTESSDSEGTSDLLPIAILGIGAVAVVSLLGSDKKK